MGVGQWPMGVGRWWVKMGEWMVCLASGLLMSFTLLGKGVISQTLK